jgi:hypothetical protein
MKTLKRALRPAHLSDGRSGRRRSRAPRRARARGGASAAPSAPPLRPSSTTSPGDLYDAQERYILLFDRTRSLSLQLFEHVHGESRDRGQAMVDLLKLYEDGGYTPTTASCRTSCRCSSSTPRPFPLRKRSNWSTSPATSSRRFGSASPSARHPMRQCSRRSRRWRGRASTRRRSLPSGRSPTSIPRTSRRSMPPGRRRRSRSGRVPPPPAGRTRWPHACGRRAAPRPGSSRCRGRAPSSPIATPATPESLIEEQPSCATRSSPSCSSGIPISA